MSYLPRIIESDMTINVPGDFDSVSSALRNLSPFIISGAATVTINVAAGGYTCSDNPEVWYHQSAERIRIIGDVTRITSTGIYSTSGSAGAYSITLNVSDTSGITTDYRTIVRDVSGTGAYKWNQGAWGISNVDEENSRITIVNTSSNSSIPTNTITSASVDVMKSVIVGYVIVNSSFMLIEGISFHTTTTTSSFVCNIGVPFSPEPNTTYNTKNVYAFFKTCSFSGAASGLGINESTACLFRCAATVDHSAGVGIYVYNSSSHINSCYISANYNGIIKKTSNISIINSSITGNDNAMVDSYPDGYNMTHIEGSSISWNSGTALLISNSALSCKSVDIQGNGAYAVYAYSNSDVTLIDMTIKNNYGTTADIYAIGNSNIYCEVTSGTYSHPKTLPGIQYDSSPAHETVGNYNSYVEAY